MDSIDGKYLKGFNHAYILAEHKSILLEKLLATTTENEYLQGMSDGKRTFEQEQNQTKTRLQELNQLNIREDKEQDRER